MNNTIITYGFSDEQSVLLESALAGEYEVTPIVCITDLIVTDAVCTVVNAQTLSKEGMRALLAYYMDVGDLLDETVVWIGDTELPDLPSFAHCDDYLQLILNCEQIITQAQNRYNTMQQYTDIYSYLPKYAIAECIEAEIFTNLENDDQGLFHGFLQKGWIKVQQVEKGPELLAAVYELSRWLRKEKIPYWLKWSVPWGELLLALDFGDVFLLDEENADYTFCIRKEDLPRIEKWLRNHWYFRNPDDRLKIRPVDGLENGIDTQLLDI